MLELTFYVPQSHLEEVKEAVFAAGAGHMGDYDRCCWQTMGEGQFRPLQGADPYIGEPGEVAQVKEYKVEMICDEAKLPSIIAALKQAHPYEEPAYNVHRLLDV